MRVVVDTNVLVSALLNVHGTPAKIVSLVLNGKILLLYDNRIMIEYFEVLSRKEFGFNEEIVNDMIEFFKHEGEYINAEHQRTRFHDETDKKFYEVYKSGKADYVITGNRRHFPADHAVVIPGEFIRIYEKLKP